MDVAPLMGMWTFARRLIGASALSAATYEEVEADRGSMGQAVGSVLLSAIAAGVGARGLGVPPSFVPTMAVVALLAWTSWAMLTYQIGVRMLPTTETRSDLYEMMRTMGFAAAPGILRIFGVVPVLAKPLFVVTAIWMLLAMIVAVRQALDYRSTARAIAVCVVGWLLAIAAVVAFSLFSPRALSAQSPERAPNSVFQVTVARGTARLAATAVLVQSVWSGPDATFYFLTGGSLFRSASGTLLPQPDSISIRTPAGLLEVRAEDVTMPHSTLVDIALLKARGQGPLPLPRLMLATPPDSFEITGFDQDDQLIHIPERLRRAATLQLLGDRALDAIKGCEGAPAWTNAAIFGIVTRCQTGSFPVVVPLAVIATWVEQTVPGGLHLAAPLQTSTGPLPGRNRALFSLNRGAS